MLPLGSDADPRLGLFLPRSRMQEYLSHLGRTVLASFPVQATLHFYNDEDSSSEDEADAH